MLHGYTFLFNVEITRFNILNGHFMKQKKINRK